MPANAFLEFAGPRPEPAADLTDSQWTRLTRLQSEYKVKLANRQRAYLLGAHKPQSPTSPHMTPVMTTVQAGYGKLVQ
jgi:hypothetical protein